MVHGDAETAEDADLIYGALHRLAGECGPLAGYRGGNGYTTFLFAGPAAAAAAKAFLARAQAMEHPPVVAHHRHGAPRLALRKGPRS